MSSYHFKEGPAGGNLKQREEPRRRALHIKISMNYACCEAGWYRQCWLYGRRRVMATIHLRLELGLLMVRR